MDSGPSLNSSSRDQAVVLAAPFHQTGIELVNTPAPALIPKQAYVRLFVTFVITKCVALCSPCRRPRPVSTLTTRRPKSASTPQPSYFDLPPDTRMPNEIFGTFTTPSRHKPTFNSLNYLKALPASIGARFGEGTFHVVKMFSSRSLEPEMLDTLYGAGNVAKVVEKVWFAYPQLAPVRSEDDFAPVRPDEGLYYVNAFERLISTMETEVRRARLGLCTGSLARQALSADSRGALAAQTVSAFNVVSLLLNDFFGYTPPTSWAEWDDGDA